jgi:polysaccharide export outer membrane protein
MKILTVPFLLAASLAVLVGMGTGCKSSPEMNFAETAAIQQAVEASNASDPIIFREGDSVRITFPGAPQLNTIQAIRRDGKLVLPMVGEVTAIGLTPKDLEKHLLDLYGPQLQTKEISVTLESVAFQVYVVGTVARAGKVVADRPLTAFEAIIEAGGFDGARSNMKHVRIIRHENGRPQYFDLNLKAFMQGKDTQPFKLKPFDIVYVPERFTWF